jgi:hypothetical protein
MKYTYEEVADDFGNKSIKRTDEDGLVAWIPMDGGNSDYQAYLKSLDETATL